MAMSLDEFMKTIPDAGPMPREFYETVLVAMEATWNQPIAVPILLDMDRPMEVLPEAPTRE